MGLDILLAEPLDLLRAGLRTILEADSRVSRLYEVADTEDLHVYIDSREFDLIVVNQLLITEMHQFLKKRFVVIAIKLDLEVLKAAYMYEACGYLSINVSTELLLTLLRPVSDAFLIEPTLVPWLMDHIFDTMYASINDEVLTSREREVVDLLRKGFDRSTICEQLCIAETTLKTHIKNITRKSSYIELLKQKDHEARSDRFSDP